MEHLPLDARSVVDELRSAPRPPSGEEPRAWMPSASFDALVEGADVVPVLLDDHLTWLHEHGNLAGALAPPPGGGAKGWTKRLVHRAVLAVLNPYLVQVQDCITETVRALDAVARRVDEQAAAQVRSTGAMRSDLVDLARYLEERLEQ